MKRIWMTLLSLCAIPVFAFEAADYSITDVSAKSRAPWQTLIDVDFTLVAPDGAPADALVQVEIVASNGCERLVLSPASLHAPLAKPGRNRFIWDASKTYAGRTLAHVRFYLSVADVNPEKAPYFTLNMRTGERNWYPTDFASRLSGNNFYKTAFMPFRYIPATTSDAWKNAHDGQDFFMMGSPANEPYRLASDAAREAYVPIRLTKGFWMGVYPVTAFQIESFGAKRTTYAGDGDTTAARGWCAHYSAVRGRDGADSGFCFGKDVDARGWPAVDSQSFIGKLRTLTGLCVDFPTDAQWEYACRAGTTNAYWFGIENIWQGSNSGRPGPSRTLYVGGQAPNAWGLYDMVGCVHNWTTTLGKYANGENWVQSAADDPTGPVAENSSPTRITRGSHFVANGHGGTDTLGNEIEAICYRVYRSAYRFPQNSANGDCEWDLIGFRLCIPEDQK